jgi:hypothetical protein
LLTGEKHVEPKKQVAEDSVTTWIGTPFVAFHRKRGRPFKPLPHHQAFHRLIHCHEVKISTNAIATIVANARDVVEVAFSLRRARAQLQISVKDVIHGHETSCRPQGFY